MRKFPAELPRMSQPAVSRRPSQSEQEPGSPGCENTFLASSFFRYRSVQRALIISIARAASLETQADDLPTRHEGLWRISTLSADAGLQVSEACVRAGDSIIGEIRQGCSKPQVTRHGDQTIVTIVCEEESQNNVTSLLFTGDYVAWYRAQGKITSRDRMSGAEMHSDSRSTHNT